MVKNLYWSSSRYYCQILTKTELLDRFSKNTEIQNFMKIRLVGAKFFHADGQTDRHDEANSRSSQFCERA
jgi:hypothetical protein